MLRRAVAMIAMAIVALVATSAAAVSAPVAAKPKPVEPDGTRVTAAAAKSPSMSPAAQYVKYSKYGVRAFSCPDKYLCVDAWDPTRSTYKVFFIKTCATRHLSYFTSAKWPELKNNQTRGTVTRFLNKSGKEIKADRSVAKHGPRHINWDPVWHIDVC